MLKKVYFLLVLFFIAASIFAGGKREEPVLTAETSGAQYISPNGDGLNDEADLNFIVELYIKSKAGYVPEYGVKITDESGAIVKEIVETEKSDLNWFSRLFKKYAKFTLEKSITWDGKDSGGNVVPEGKYSVLLWIKDTANIERETYLDDYIVDLTPPSVIVEWPEDTVFSPDGDGSKDFFEIYHLESSEEHLWIGEFHIEDDSLNPEEYTTVRRYEWPGHPPEILIWDGADEEGNIVSDGTYSYRLNCTDRAGNSMQEIVIDNIVVDTRVPDIIFELSEIYISPNGDGVKDMTVLTFGHYELEGIGVESWEVNLSDSPEEGNKKVIYTGGESGVFEAVFDGADDNGGNIPDGTYYINFITYYTNGAVVIYSEEIYIDRVPPKVSINIRNRIFDPGSDDADKNQTEITFRSNKEVVAAGVIEDSMGEVVAEFIDWGIETEDSLIWDGRDDSENDLPDGDYYLVTEFADIAGNSFMPAKEKITLKRVAGAVDIVVVPGAIRASEGNDSTGLYFNILVDPEYMDRIQSWELVINDEAGETKASFNGESQIPDHIIWEAKDIPGEGFYNARLIVNYSNGAKNEKVIDNIFNDLTAPDVSQNITPSPFAALGKNSYEGKVDIALNVTENDKCYGWEVSVQDDKETVIASYKGDGEPPQSVIWDGKANSGYVLENNKTYFVVSKVTDMAGNTGSAKGQFLFDAALVKKDGKYYIATDDIIFAAYKAELNSAGKTRETANLASLKKVADFNKKYPNYIITLEGNALNVLLGQGTDREKKEEDILVKVVDGRISSVKNALLKAGVPETIIKIINNGGKKPIVPVNDLDDRWKDRRVTFSVEQQNLQK